MEPFNDLIEATDDGCWHSINEVSTKGSLKKLSMTELMKFLDILTENNFVEQSDLEIRLTPPLLTFTRNIKWTERAEKNTKHTFLFWG